MKLTSCTSEAGWDIIGAMLDFAGLFAGVVALAGLRSCASFSGESLAREEGGGAEMNDCLAAVGILVLPATDCLLGLCLANFEGD